MMKLREIFRFEFGYQVRSATTWIFFAGLAVVAFLMITQNSIHDARNGDYQLNSPYAIAVVTVFGCLFWLLAAAPIAGNAAVRDLQSRIHPLTFTVPVRKSDYLGGRFLAAFVLNALILLAIPAGIFLGIRSPGVETDILGPFRPAAYGSAYLLIALPNAFAATAIQFTLATLSRRSITSYLGSVLLFVTAFFVPPIVLALLGQSEVAKLLDPVGVVTVVSVLANGWTPLEKNTLLLGLQGSLLWNRLVWIGIGLGMLGLTHLRFRFSHPANRRGDRNDRSQLGDFSLTANHAATERSPVPALQSPGTFAWTSQLRQLLAIASKSLGLLLRSPGGPLFLAPLGMLMVLAVPQAREFLDVPLVPRTGHLLTFLATPLANPRNGLWMVIPLLTIFYAGELVWRERNFGQNDIVDTAPVREWVLFLGKFLGLGLALAVWLAVLMGSGILLQTIMGHSQYELGLYLKILFGLQLSDYLLFALLALGIQVVVNQKQLGYLVTLLAYACIARASLLGLSHNLLVYGSAPRWSYSDMSGFGGSLWPWLWFKLYWVAWALLLAAGVRLLWVRGHEQSVRLRLRLARQRFTRATAGAVLLGAGCVLALGSFNFYNTNILNDFDTVAARNDLRARYEHSYGQYRMLPQPRLTGTELRVELYPARGEADIRASYLLRNDRTVPIDSVHLATRMDLFFGEASRVEISHAVLDRAARPELIDEQLGYRIYGLEEPIQPGQSLRLSFQVRFHPLGFTNAGIDPAVVANGTYFTSQSFLPALGYQAIRELTDDRARKARGLPPRPVFPPAHDAEARLDTSRAARMTFEAVVGTEEGQVAVAPGSLRETWNESGRSYFRYATDVPIASQYAIFSADYARLEDRWNDIAIEILHHPDHDASLDSMLRSVRASLDHYSELYGPYPYRHIRLVEHPGRSLSPHAEATTIDFEESFALLNPEEAPRGLDLMFWVTAHEVAHQWGVPLARVEGAILLSESLATYSAIQVTEKIYGVEYLRRFLHLLRYTYPVPHTRASVPLLQATDSYLGYRKGPFALYALGEYIGRDAINAAIRQFRQHHLSGSAPLPTSLELYEELQRVTPDSFRSLLHDLFEENTFWEFEATGASARETETDGWQIRLDLSARKLVVDEVGAETEVPLDDWVEIGLFSGSGEELYLEKQRIRSGLQTITMHLPDRPDRAGIDPNHLLIEWQMDDNVVGVETGDTAAVADPSSAN